MKITKILLWILCLFFMITFMGVKGSEVMQSYDGLGSYRETHKITEQEIAYQVMHQKMTGQTATQLHQTPSGGAKNEAGLGSTGVLLPNVFYNQQVNILSGKTNDQVKAVSWGFTTDTKYQMRTITALARDYEEKNPGWKVIGGINADFYDINGGMNLPYQPIGPMVSGGESIRISGSHNYSLMIGFKNDGSSDALVAKKYIHNEDGVESILSSYQLYIYNQEGEIIDQIELDGFNVDPDENQTTVSYATWNANKEITPFHIPASSSSVFVVRQADKALANTERDFYGRGQISMTGPTTLQEGSFAILSKDIEVIQKLSVGTYIRVQREFLGEFSGIAEITSGHGFLLENNQESPLLNESYYYTRAPRAIVGQKADGTVVMMTVDGRNAEKQMYGVTQEEMAAICKYYGLVDAYNLDGGGSATFMVRSGDDFVVTNTPSDGNVRAISNAIFFVVYEPEISIGIDTIQTDSITVDIDVLGANGHDLDKIFITLDDQTKEVTSSNITFDNLLPNTTYTMKVYYQNKEEETLLTTLGINVRTAKRTPTLLGIDFDFTGARPILKTSFYDPDQSITRLSVTMAGTTFFVISNQATINQGAFTSLEDITPYTLLMRYDVGDGSGFKEIAFSNPHFYTQMMLLKANSVQTEMIHKILN